MDKNIIPDRWAILEIEYENGKKCNKILSGNYSALDYSATWRLSSQIVEVSFNESKQLFEIGTYSGSKYTLMKDRRGLTPYTREILDGILRDSAKISVKVELNKYGPVTV